MRNAGGGLGSGGAEASRTMAGDEATAGGGAFDVLRLAALAAAASSAASSTAYAVDAVVKEALLFFATMPPQQTRRRGGSFGEGPHLTEESQGVFKNFGQRANADARAAAEACAMTHQLVVRSGGDRGMEGTHSSAVAAALAAGRVGTHADRTAATAREAALLCMGILEEAVQANASPLARETAKRCAEQALHSIEAATAAEQHNRSLHELLARVLPAGSEPGPGRPQGPGAGRGGAGGGGGGGGMGATGSGPHGAGRGGAARGGRGRQGALRAEEAQAQRERGGNAAAPARGSGGGAAPPVKPAPAPAPPAAATPAPPRRWWDSELDAATVAAAVHAGATGSAAAPLAGTSLVPAPPPPPAAGSRLEDALRSGEELERYLAERVRLCAKEAGPAAEELLDALGRSGGQHDDAAATDAGGRHEDLAALRAILEWRYGTAVASGTHEDEVLSDAEAAALATWRCPRGHAGGPPQELLEAACRRGPDHAAALLAALRAATRQAPREPGALQPAEAGQAPPVGAALAQAPFPGAFQRWKEQGEAPAPDWDAALDRLGWRPAAASNGRPRTLQPPPGSVTVEAAVASILSWQSSGVPADPRAPVAPQEPLDDDWSVDDLSSRQLHTMSMHSRSKQRRGGAAKPPKGSGGVEDPAPVTGGGAAATASPEEDEAEARAVLRDIFGDWEAEAATVAASSQPGPATASAGPPSQRAPAGPHTAEAQPQPRSGSSAAAATGAASTGGRRKKGPGGGTTSPPQGLVAPGAGGPPLSAASVAVAASPVHRLIEPPQLLDAALSRQRGESQVGDLGDEEEDTFDVVERRGCESSQELLFDQLHRLMPLQSGRGLFDDRGAASAWRPYHPGQLLQQRLPRTFHESMEHIAVERREAFGMPFMSAGHSGNWPCASSMASAGLIGNRARTFAEGLRPALLGFGKDYASPIPTPAGTYIGTPTWTSADSGEFALHGREDPSSPRYVPTSPSRWAAAEQQQHGEMGVTSSGSERGGDYGGAAAGSSGGGPGQAFSRGASALGGGGGAGGFAPGPYGGGAGLEARAGYPRFISAEAPHVGRGASSGYPRGGCGSWQQPGQR